MFTTLVQSGGLFASVTCACVLMILSGCGGNKNAVDNHPGVAIYDRSASRIERIELIIDDPIRAKRVKACYVEIERLLKNSSDHLQSLQMQLKQQDWNSDLSDAQIHEVFSRFHQEQADIQQRYVALQLEIRKNATEDEFRRIDKLR